MLKVLSFFVAVSFVNSTGLAASPVKQTVRKPATAVTAQKRAPSNTKVGTCSEHGCACDDLSKQTQVCASVLSPADSAPRSQKSMKDCYLTLVQKRRMAMAKGSCPLVEKSSGQIEDLRMLLARSDSATTKDQHVSSSKGLEGFGLDLVGHLDSNHRTPASGN